MGIYCRVHAVPAADVSRLFNPRQHSQDPTTTSTISLEKAWHGLHFLLTGQAHGGTAPLSFLVDGGQAVGDPDEWGYGPPRVFTPAEVLALHSALAGISPEQLWSRYDPGQMEEVYPQIWDEPEEELREEYLTYFGTLKELIASAAAKGQAIVVVFD
jgi:hypothetical protein